MLTRLLRRTTSNISVRSASTATTPAAAAAAITATVAPRKWATSSSSTPVRPRAPYVRRTATTAAATPTPIAAVAPSIDESPLPVDPVVADKAPVDTIKVARRSTTVKVVERDEHAQHMDRMEMETMLPEVPLMATRSIKAATPTTSSMAAGSSDYPSMPFPLASASIGASSSSASAAASPMLDNVPISSAPEVDWTTSFHGMSSQPFSERAAQLLMRPLTPQEIEIKPDGLLYLPEILYRRILNQAFGPGGWGMVPRGEMTVAKMMVSREWGLIAGGRLVSVARGEQLFFDPSGLPTATEGCKSNALMRCCKDLGIASELWDPGFIRGFKSQHCVEAWTEHVTTKKKQRRWRMKTNKFEYPLRETSA